MGWDSELRVDNDEIVCARLYPWSCVAILLGVATNESPRMGFKGGRSRLQLLKILRYALRLCLYVQQSTQLLGHRILIG